jgi:hypothetical protein
MREHKVLPLEGRMASDKGQVFFFCVPSGLYIANEYRKYRECSQSILIAVPGEIWVIRKAKANADCFGLRKEISAFST